jgi:hypothetical protein
MNGMRAVDSTGTEYRRIPRVTFGLDQSNRTLLVQDFVSYSKAALYTPVGAWLSGGASVMQANMSSVTKPVMRAQGQGLHFADATSADIALGVTTTAFTTAGGGSALGLLWSDPTTAGTLPQYYKKAASGWTVIPASQVPRRTWLTDQVFTKNSRATVTPANTGSTAAYSSANWAAGPFTATLNNGSSVDYVWYKFVDQPAIARLGLSIAEKASLQAWAESVHGLGLAALNLPPPSAGKLATFDAGLFVTPPAALSRGYVPIVIAQR